jgi:hypothetical protein
MWSKTDSELKDIARKRRLKGHTALPGCYEAPSNFSPQSVGYFSSDGKISIVGMLEVDIKASRMVCSVVAGSFFIYLFFPAKYQ